ncbi:MAG TPA: hypothetical protein ACFCUC_03445 [Desulfobacterales bacterium]
MNGYLGNLLKRLGLVPSPSIAAIAAIRGGQAVNHLPAGGVCKVLRPAQCVRIENRRHWRPVGWPAAIRQYLHTRGNPDSEIERVVQLLDKPQLVVEIGCGAGEVACAIARHNPDTAVLATDAFDVSAGPSSHYGLVAREWESGRLNAQQPSLPNLALLRAEGDLIDRLPDGCIDSVLLIHPEPRVAAEFFNRIQRRNLKTRFKSNRKSLIIKPFSREIGVMACGGLEFDHPRDWSRGLGFLIESPFVFRSCQPVHWGVDLSRCSPYSRHSTQPNVFVCRNLSVYSHDCLLKARLVKNSNLL